MREITPHGWHRWRVAVKSAVPTGPVFDRMTRLGSPALKKGSESAPVAPATEVQGADGIRHDLVARVRQQIADGTYDTEEKWLLAEEALLRRVEGRL